jgi:hypothetical protein
VVVGYVARLASEKSVRQLVEVSRLPGVEHLVDRPGDRGGLHVEELPLQPVPHLVLGPQLLTSLHGPGEARRMLPDNGRAASHAAGGHLADS